MPGHDACTTDRAARAKIEALFRRGDLAGALAEGHAALRAGTGDPALIDLLGTIRCHSELLRRALDLAPEQLETRIRLANALAMLGDAAGAEALCIDDASELLRLRGFLMQSQGRFAEAAECYERIVACDPGDWEIWNNLGNSRQAAGDLSGAVDALGQARQLRPDLAPIQLNLALALAAAGRLEESIEPCAQAARLQPRNPAAALELGRRLSHLGRYAEALQPLIRAEALSPNDADVQVELGRVKAALGEFDDAEAGYRKALQLSVGRPVASVELGIILERTNRVRELKPLIDAAAAQGVSPADRAYLCALLLRSEGRTEEALTAAREVPPEVQPLRTALLIGQLEDRIGDPAVAFEAFRQANALTANAPSAAGINAADARDRVRDLTVSITPDWYGSWTARVPEERPSPVFLVGFPRSGTTLLDTILMGHERVAVLEEERTFQRVEELLSGFERLAKLDPAEIAHLRTLYFEDVDRALPDAAGKLVVDKLPLNILRLPLIHRLFPDARIVFAQRHPCDVVLSCFMQNFELNDAMANFLDLGDAAEFYDLVMALWERCRAVFPLAVHNVRYEAVVEDLEPEARALLEFVGLPWDPGVLDHSSTARARSVINTPSYSQVIQPIYRQASGRWERYRAQMAPVLPVLAPWVRRLGYGDICP